MDFKIGDIVYCINNHYTLNKPTSSLIVYLDLHTPYEIKDITFSKEHVYLKGITYKQNVERFISEIDYITVIRKSKIGNIKKNIKNDRKISTRYKRNIHLY